MAKKPAPRGGSNYRNPPEHTRFRKGQSGNPRGRPKGSRNFRTLLEEELEQSVDISENGRSVKLTKQHIIAKSLVNEAAKGNPRAWAILLPMISGKSADETTEVDEATAAMIASFLARYTRLIEELGGKPGGITKNDEDGADEDGDEDAADDGDDDEADDDSQDQ